MADELDILATQRRIWQSALTTPEKVTAQVLLAHWSRSGEVFPSVLRIAAWTSQGRATVIRAIASLEAKGAIRCIRTPGRPTHYDLTPLAALPVPEGDRYQSETGITETPHPSHSEPGPVSERDPNESMNDPKKGSSFGATPSPATKRKRKKTSEKSKETLMPPEWQPTEAHREFAAKHQLDVELEATGFRGHFDGRKVASWNGRFATWLANQAKWNRQRGVRKANGRLPDQQRGMAAGVVEGRL